MQWINEGEKSSQEQSFWLFAVFVCKSARWSEVRLLKWPQKSDCEQKGMAFKVQGKIAGIDRYIREDIWEYLLLLKSAFCRSYGRNRLVKNTLFLKGHHHFFKWDFFKTDVVVSQLKNKFWSSWLTTKSVHVSLF